MPWPARAPAYWHAAGSFLNGAAWIQVLQEATGPEGHNMEHRDPHCCGKPSVGVQIFVASASKRRGTHFSGFSSEASGYPSLWHQQLRVGVFNVVASATERRGTHCKQCFCEPMPYNGCCHSCSCSEGKTVPHSFVVTRPSIVATNFPRSSEHIGHLIRLLPILTTCRCGGASDPLGDHRAACPTAGVLCARSAPLESAAARVCREAGARVASNVLLRDMNIDAPALDARRIEVLWPMASRFGTGRRLSLTPLGLAGDARPATWSPLQPPEKGGIHTRNWRQLAGASSSWWAWKWAGDLVRRRRLSCENSQRPGHVKCRLVCDPPPARRPCAAGRACLQSLRSGRLPTRCWNSHQRVLMRAAALSSPCSICWRTHLAFGMCPTAACPP